MFYYVLLTLQKYYVLLCFIGGGEYMNKIVGYRKMLGMTQEKMAEKFNISVQAYRMKEKQKINFNRKEMIIFRDLLRKELFPKLLLMKYFFNLLLCFTMKRG